MQIVHLSHHRVIIVQFFRSQLHSVQKTSVSKQTIFTFELDKIILNEFPKVIEK